MECGFENRVGTLSYLFSQSTKQCRLSACFGPQWRALGCRPKIALKTVQSIPRCIIFAPHDFVAQRRRYGREAEFVCGLLQLRLKKDDHFAKI